MRKERLTRQDREHCRHYIPTDAQDVAVMLQSIQLGDLSDLYAHIPNEFRFDETSLSVPDELTREALQDAMETIAKRNQVNLSLIGDGFTRL